MLEILAEHESIDWGAVFTSLAVGLLVGVAGGFGAVFAMVKLIVPRIDSGLDEMEERIANIGDAHDLLIEAVQTDGEHHKQWYLEEIARYLRVELPDHEEGIAP